MASGGVEQTLTEAEGVNVKLLKVEHLDHEDGETLLKQSVMEEG